MTDTATSATYDDHETLSLPTIGKIHRDCIRLRRVACSATTQLAVQTNALGSSVETKDNYKNLLSHSVCEGLIEWTYRNRSRRSLCCFTFYWPVDLLAQQPSSRPFHFGIIFDQHLRHSIYIKKAFVIWRPLP